MYGRNAHVLNEPEQRLRFIWAIASAGDQPKRPECLVGHPPNQPLLLGSGGCVFDCLRLPTQRSDYGRQQLAHLFRE